MATAADRTERLDLDRQRDLGDLLSTAFTLFFRHLGVFLTIALVVVAPVVLLVDGVWGGVLADADDADPSVAASVVSAALSALVIPTLVTAAHVTAVQQLGHGEAPRVGASLARAGRVFAPVIVVVLLYALAVALGFVALIIPGIYLGVRLYFGAQSVIVDDRHGADALRRSAELTKDDWWRTFGTLIVLGILSAILGAVVGLPLGAIAGASDSGALLVVARVLEQTIALSFTALAATLLFFDLRARKQLPWQGESARPLPSAPERPESPAWEPPSAGPAS